MNLETHLLMDLNTHLADGSGDLNAAAASGETPG